MIQHERVVNFDFRDRRWWVLRRQGLAQGQLVVPPEWCAGLNDEFAGTRVQVETKAGDVVFFGSHRARGAAVDHAL